MFRRILIGLNHLEWTNFADFRSAPCAIEDPGARRSVLVYLLLLVIQRKQCLGHTTLYLIHSHTIVNLLLLLRGRVFDTTVSYEGA